MILGTANITFFLYYVRVFGKGKPTFSWVVRRPTPSGTKQSLLELKWYHSPLELLMSCYCFLIVSPLIHLKEEEAKDPIK